MWVELGKTIRKAMDSWAETWRMTVLVLVLTVAAVTLLVVAAR